ncbi:MAG: hypothetical protein Q7R33_00735 [Nitrosarchaeum sp.]|nr:hypothetical protein [Nitrosarchaeum sp.]
MKTDVKNLQYLSFELAPCCNLAKDHPWCPINDPLRYPKYESRHRCPDEKIVEFVMTMIFRGFRGHFAFHFYSDPLIDIRRFLNLIQSITHLWAPAKFCLWTNGVLLDAQCQNWLHLFSQINVTLYRPEDKSRIEKLTTGHNVRFMESCPDDRRQIYDCTSYRKISCQRPAIIELPVNYYGNIRLCCADYRGCVSIGNIQFESHDNVITAFEEAAQQALLGNIKLCQQCAAMKHNSVS